MPSAEVFDRLSAARPALPGSLADGGDEDRILDRILASDLPAGRATRRRTTLVLVVAVLVAAAAVASLEIGHGNRPVASHGGRHPVALNGARIQLAGYHFRTPAGFKASKSSCISAPVADKPRPTIDGFAAAASADGGCVQAVGFVAADWLQAHGQMPDAADLVDVGDHHGYFVSSQASGGKMTLYVNLPNADGQRVVYLVLVSRGLSADQLIAVAESGLPTLPPAGPTPTAGTEGGG
jgi:hypothetical protein